MAEAAWSRTCKPLFMQSATVFKTVPVANRCALPYKTWSPGWDSNPHATIVSHSILSTARLPITPPGDCMFPKSDNLDKEFLS